MQLSKFLLLWLWLLAVEISIALPSFGQIVPDRTVGTTVAPNLEINGIPSDRIDDGTVRGSNLFHSFQEFNIQSGRGVYFTTPQGISNIFTRITGSNPSNINGVLGILGNANLFFLNPNGIIFNAGARLDLKGSFVATTADRINFADRTFFSATNPETSPLLTVSTPIGLQLGANAGAIRVQQGTPIPFLGFRSPQLSLPPGQTLALVASQIDLDGTTLSVPDGRVELWAVRNAEVALDRTGWQLASLADTADWGAISLRQTSRIDTDGKNGGPIQVRGRGLTLQDGSTINSTTGPFGQGQGITVKTTEFIDLLGISAPNQLPNPGLITSVIGDKGRSGDVTVETERLRLENGGFIQSTISFSFDSATQKPISSNNARTGNVTVRARDVDVIGYTPFPSPYLPPGTPLDAPGNITPTSINTIILAGADNETGTISIEAQRLRLLNGGSVSTSLIGLPNLANIGLILPSGKTGDINIRAAESLEITGVALGGTSGSIRTSIQPLSQGQSGNITIDTGRLLVSQGGALSSALAGNGIAGNINIRATEVAVSDPVIDTYNKTISGITVAVVENAIGQGGNITLEADRLRVFNGGQVTSSTLGNGSAGNIRLEVNSLEVEGNSQPLPDGRQLPSSISAASTTLADAGSVNLVANSIDVRDGGQISVSNSGGGDAGNLQVSANRIQLDEAGSLRSEVAAGDRGNITLNTDSLLMRRASQITTNATGTATGGNIAIATDTLTSLENSDITANALQGQGGNIQIATQGIFLAPNSDITASSQLGVSGTVNISILNFNPENVVFVPQNNFVGEAPVIASSCLTQRNTQQGRFVVSGNGSLSETPDNLLMPYETVQVGVLSQFRQRENSSLATTNSRQLSYPLQEATGFNFTSDGKVALVVDKGKIASPRELNCHN